MAATLSKIDAVNMMLEAVFEQPVSSIVTPGIASAAMAKRILDEVSMSVQTRGWTFNTDEGMTLSRDVNSKFPLPDNVLSIDTVGNDRDVDAVQRGKFLYDRGNYTYLFPNNATLIVKIVSLLEFDEMPQAARYYVATMASRFFQSKWLNQPLAAADEIEMAALANVEEAEADSGDFNVMNDSYSVASILQR